MNTRLRTKAQIAYFNILVIFEKNCVNGYDDCSSVISIAPQSKGVGDHPAVYPETLVEKIIRMHSFVGDTVVDCSNGSGSTTAVAARLGRRWFGCDISPKYCKVAESRTQKAYKQFLKSIKDVDEAKNDKSKAA